jgi:hypothetical protein
VFYRCYSVFIGEDFIIYKKIVRFIEFLKNIKDKSIKSIEVH